MFAGGENKRAGDGFAALTHDLAGRDRAMLTPAAPTFRPANFF
jgi:hypothetical protein